MKLTTHRLELIPLSESYFEHIHNLHSYSQVAQFNTIGIPKDFSVTKEMLVKVMAKERSLHWAIFEKEQNKFVGEIGMNLSSEKYRKGEIHYSLHPDIWGNGYATESVKAIINFGFSELRLHRIEAGVAVENSRSVALLERTGMTREGLCRKILPLESGWADNYMYAVLEDDPREY